jgi:hypothetical protein
VHLGEVAVDADPLEILVQAGVVLGLDADADPSAVVVEIAAEDLGDAELAAVVRGVLESDRPARDHDVGVPDGGHPHLDHAVPHEPEALLRLLLPHDEVVAEPVLADAASPRPGELARLQV